MGEKQIVEVQIINAFTDNDTGGNPAGVVFNADHLTNDDKLKIAQKVGLSETAFVSKSSKADFKLDFFTPVRQIPHCGHATIAVFSYLSQNGLVASGNTSKETIDGRREIYVQGDTAFMEQKAPIYTSIEQYHSEMLSSLGLEDGDLYGEAPLLVVNTGNSFAVIPVKNADTLKKVTPDFHRIAAISNELGLIGYYVFTPLAKSFQRDADARMFAPAYGIDEEAATGMAAGPLACYLNDQLGIKKQQFLIQQGWHMKQPSPSLITVNLKIKNNAIAGLMAGGKAVSKDTFTIEF
ncbi:MAG TPA: PhzF family phenazine biosynthesis protein [Lacibacter sp.]|nr:PhzF family phenazine biosynthesis protein [Lacibacter sp.]